MSMQQACSKLLSRCRETFLLLMNTRKENCVPRSQKRTVGQIKKVRRMHLTKKEAAEVIAMNRLFIDWVRTVGKSMEEVVAFTPKPLLWVRPSFKLFRITLRALDQVQSNHSAQQNDGKKLRF